MKKSISPSRFLFAFLLTQAAGLLGSIATQSSVSTWYTGLTKPIFQPPNWLFGPVWFVLYTCIAVAMYLVWKKEKSYTGKTAIQLYVHLGINMLWSFAFFGMQSPLLGFVVIVVLLAHMLYVMNLFVKKELPLALLCFVPYFFWVSFASVLNLFILLLN